MSAGKKKIKECAEDTELCQLVKKKLKSVQRTILTLMIITESYPYWWKTLWDCSISLLKTLWEKEKLHVTSQLSHQI